MLGEKYRKPREPFVRVVWRNRRAIAPWALSYLLLQLLWIIVWSGWERPPWLTNTLAIQLVVIGIIVWGCRLALHLMRLGKPSLPEPMESDGFFWTNRKAFLKWVRKERGYSDDIWKAIDPRNTKPDPGYPRWIEKLPPWLRDVAFFLSFLVMLIEVQLIVSALDWVLDNTPRALDELVGYPLFAAFGGYMWGVWLDMRRLEKAKAAKERAERIKESE